MKGQVCGIVDQTTSKKKKNNMTTKMKNTMKMKKKNYRRKSNKGKTMIKTIKWMKNLELTTTTKIFDFSLYVLIALTNSQL